jgi:hypothetical protein
MSNQENLQPRLRQEAERHISRHLTASEREALLIKCWMSHDARWFTSVADEFGLPAANRINKIAAHALGIAEGRRLAAVLPVSPPGSLEGYLLFQEMGISLLGPELLQYQIQKTNDHTFQMSVSRCFAHENVTRAGIAGEYDCGILPRMTGWQEALGIDFKLHPPLGRCLMAQGKPCAYTLSFKKGMRLDN